MLDFLTLVALVVAAGTMVLGAYQYTLLQRERRHARQLRQRGKVYYQYCLRTQEPIKDLLQVGDDDELVVQMTHALKRDRDLFNLTNSFEETDHDQ